MPIDGDSYRGLTVDASAVLSVLLDGTESGSRIANIMADTRLFTSPMLHIEVTNVLRRRRNAGHLGLHEAQQVFSLFKLMTFEIVPFEIIADRMWDLGANLSSYDASYVAVAEMTSTPLLTGDARISRTPGVACELLVVE